MKVPANSKLVCASILAADYGSLGAAIEKVAGAGVTCIHVDVMDGNYVPPISFGAGVVGLVKRHAPQCICDVHLMVEQPERHLASVIDAGAEYVSFHPETTRRAQQCVSEIHARGAKAGLALSPAVPLTQAQPLLDQLDMLLVMTVEPGFGGQNLLEGTVSKVAEARVLMDAAQSAARLEVDGGVTTDNIATLCSTGADTFVVGSGLFGASDIATALAGLTAKIG